MENVYGTQLLRYQQLFQIPVHKGSILTETGDVFHLQTQQLLYIHQFQWVNVHQDFTVMEMETALLQAQFQLHPANLDTSMTEMEFVLQLMYQLIVYLDMQVMEQEDAFQSLLHQLFAQMDTIQMVKETVFQIHQVK